MRSSTYLGESGVGELVKTERALLARMAGQLALEDAGGRHCGYAHAVPQEEDHVLGDLLDLLTLNARQHGTLGLVPPESRRWLIPCIVTWLVDQR